MRRFFIGFIVGFIILGIGIPITAIEFFNYNYSEKEYFDDVEYKESSYVYNFKDKSVNIFGIYGNMLYRSDFIEVIEDDSMNDEIKLVIKYPSELTNLYVNSEGTSNEMNIYVNYEHRHNIAFNAIRKVIKSVIEDLKDNNVYSYERTIEPKITLYVSSKNIDKINM